MAKAEITNRKIVINLELQEEEAIYLRNMLQNDLLLQFTNVREADKDKKIREEIFEELSYCLRNQ